MKYPLMQYKDMMKYEDEMIKLKVSERAREPDGFYGMFIKYKSKIPDDIVYPNYTNVNYWKRREIFLNSHYKMWMKNKTRRNYLSLICWAFNPLKGQQIKNDTL